MKDHIKRMITEHKELVARIEKLYSYVYGTQSDDDDKVEFANKCIQLKAMRIYEEALFARLENQGIACSNGEYFEKVSDEDLNCSKKLNAKVCKSDCDGSQHAE